MQNNNNKIYHSFRFAFEGVIHAFRDNRNVRIHTAVAVFVLLASFILGLTKFEKIIVILIIVMVFVAEMVNTALEEIVDLVTNEHKEEAKRAKDVAAGMVLITAVGATIVGVAVFAPYIF